MPRGTDSSLQHRGTQVHVTHVLDISGKRQFSIPTSTLVVLEKKVIALCLLTYLFVLKMLCGPVISSYWRKPGGFKIASSEV